MGSVSSTPKRKIFVSYFHHGDQAYYNELSLKYSEIYDVIHDNSLDREIQSDNTEYVMRRIREDFITGSSCAIVLCGLLTSGRKFVDWEISATLQKQHGLIGVKLPPLKVVEDSCDKPPRLQDNIDSGYAIWLWWEDIIDNPAHLRRKIEEANNRPKNLISNARALKPSNSPL